MNIKKLLLFILVLLLCGCSTNMTPKESDTGYTKINVQEVDLSEKLDLDTFLYMKDKNYFFEGFEQLVGQKETYQNDKLQITDNSLLIITSNTCSNGIGLIKDIISSEIYKDVKVYVYTPYEEIPEEWGLHESEEKIKFPTEITVFNKDERFDYWLEQNRFYNYPILLFKDKGMFVLSKIGYSTEEDLNVFIELAKKDVLCSVKLENEDYCSYLRNRRIAFDYINSKQFIEVPVGE